jgi:hypothetical protein
VLERLEIPLHNNLSESDIREYVKRRKISGSTRSFVGRTCRDTFTSIKFGTLSKGLHTTAGCTGAACLIGYRYENTGFGHNF